MIYLDNASGARPYPEVVETIVDTLFNHWGNASADNSHGQDARTIIDNVTHQVAYDINCDQDEIIWTSGACEANSLSIMSMAQVNDLHVYTSKLEHTSVNEALKSLKSNEHCIDFIQNDFDGFISLQDLESKLRTNQKYDTWRTPFVSISFANSEIGTIQNIKAISDLVHKYNGFLHVDATQMYPWVPIDVKALNIDLMSVSGQKLNCVKGVGFLYARNGIRINPMIFGSQQDGRRGGTYPTHLIAAFGKALEMTRNNNVYKDIKSLRDHLLSQLLLIDGVQLNGPGINNMRLPNNISLTINGVNASTLTTMCDLMGIIIAKGSACQSYEPTPSKTLLAIGLTPEQALNTIRISLDYFNTLDEVNQAAKIIISLIERIRSNI
jgi:cysteine desulfurase